MQLANEKSHGHKKKQKPKVNVRVNVRPLCSSWKAVKRVELDGSSPSHPSPAQDQLDGNVWRTKMVRTEKVKEVVVPPSESSCSKTSESEVAPGIVDPCDCAHCARLHELPSAIDLSDPKKNLKKKSEKRGRSKIHKPRPRSQSVKRSYSAPPNSEATTAGRKRWRKLYGEACQPSKPVELKKIPSVPGQIGMFEVVPDEEPEKFEQKEDLHDMKTEDPGPTVIKPPILSSNSNSLVSLAPQPPQPAPAEPEPQPEPQPKPIEPIIQVEMPKTSSSDNIILVPPSPTASISAEGVAGCHFSMIHRLEQMFYHQETSWWLFVGLVILTIFAYRSSMEQHTCYYD